MRARPSQGNVFFQVLQSKATVLVLAFGLPLQAQVFHTQSNELTYYAPSASITHESTATPDGSDDLPADPGHPVSQPYRKPDRNRAIYHKNKLEFSFETGWLPINIPFVFDFMLGDPYTRSSGISYTMVPNILSLRWQMDNVGAPWIFRGNWELSFSGSATIIPRGAETRYFAYDMGIRRYFVQRNWRAVPFFEGRLGMGDINAGEPRGIPGSQGQNFTFTVMLGSGMRFNLNRRYAFWAGVSYMHVSNLYLSEPRYPDYGINVYGPMFGIDMALGRHREK